MSCTTTASPTSPVPNTHDPGLVILDQGIVMSEYDVLPAAGTLDGFDETRDQKDTVFTVSGYGLSCRTQAHSTVHNISFRVRLMATSTLVNLGSMHRRSATAAKV